MRETDRPPKSGGFGLQLFEPGVAPEHIDTSYEAMGFMMFLFLFFWICYGNRKRRHDTGVQKKGITVFGNAGAGSVTNEAIQSRVGLFWFDLRIHRVAVCLSVTLWSAGSGGERTLGSPERVTRDGRGDSYSEMKAAKKVHFSGIVHLYVCTSAGLEFDVTKHLVCALSMDLCRSGVPKRSMSINGLRDFEVTDV
jgi:hypothetical protein